MTEYIALMPGCYVPKLPFAVPEHMRDFVEECAVRTQSCLAWHSQLQRFTKQLSGGPAHICSHACQLLTGPQLGCYVMCLVHYGRYRAGQSLDLPEEEARSVSATVAGISPAVQAQVCLAAWEG